ncbi:MAG: COG1361 S-layer family protein [Methanosarcinaceae archaeon]
MGIRKDLTFAILLVVLFMCIHPASGNTDIRPTVSVSYTTYPTVLMPGDTGTITITLENMATGEIYVKEDDETFDMNAYIRSAVLGGNADIDVLNSGYTNIGLMGPGDTLELTFNIQASESASDGTHFMDLELVGGNDMYDLNYRIPVKINDRGIKLIVSNLPYTTMNEISIVSLDVVNTRPNDVTGVIVTASGEGVAFTPAEKFVGTISTGNRSNVAFTLNTMRSEQGEKKLSFSTSYFNGDNIHHSDETIASISVVNRSALIFTGLEISHIGNKYTFTGDINNFGTTDAKNVMVSIIGSNDVHPLQPNANYFIGTLETDDFSSFDLSARLTSGVSSVPILIEFRDTDDAYSSLTSTLDVDDATLANTSENESDGMTSTTWAIIGIAALAILGLIGYTWKKRKNDNIQD